MKRQLFIIAVIVVLALIATACSCSERRPSSSQATPQGQGSAGDQNSGQVAPTTTQTRQSPAQHTQAQPDQSQAAQNSTPRPPRPTKTPFNQQQNPPQNQPQPTVTPTTGLYPPPLSGAYTILTNECFDFTTAGKVNCGGTDADIWFASQGPSSTRVIVYQNDLELSSTFTSAPSKADCEAASYLPGPYNLTANPTTRYFCFKAPAGMAGVTYGWFQPVVFNTELLSFNFTILGSGTAQANPAVAPIQGEEPMINLEQITLTDGKCYDLNAGASVSCSSINADIKYTGADRSLASVYSLGWGWYRDYAPDKDECIGMSFVTGYTYLNALTLPDDHICFQLPSLENLYGWIRPTRMNSGGVTFDYVIFSP